jgi:hypothetical protein
VGIGAGVVHRFVAVVPPDAVGRLVVGAQDFKHDPAAARYIQRRGLDRVLIATGRCAWDSLRYRAQSSLVSFSNHASAAGSEVKKRVGTG